METDKNIRKPKQKRSINTKAKIREAALKLFCEKGYFKTTTNEIAKVAGISIGSLYSYFSDKDAVFFEILDEYNELFNKVFYETLGDLDPYKTDAKIWLYKFLEGMIKVHEASKDLNIEIKIMAYSRTEIAEISRKHDAISRKRTLDYLYKYRDIFKVEDIEAASVVAFNLISSTVDYIAFGENEIERERIIKATVDMMYKFLMA